MGKKRYGAVLPKKFDGGEVAEFDTEAEIIKHLKDQKFRKNFIIRDRMTGDVWDNPYNPKKKKKSHQPVAVPREAMVNPAMANHITTMAELEDASRIGGNPDEEEEGDGVQKARGASWTGAITWRGVTFRAKLFKLYPEALLAKKSVFFRDRRTGTLATQVNVDAVTRQPVRYNRIWLNEEKLEVSKGDIESRTIDEGNEVLISQYPKTDPIVCDWEIAPTEEGDLVVVQDGTYEVVPVSEEDIYGMYKMFDLMKQLGKYPAGEFVRAKSFTKVGIVFSPRNDNAGNFTLIAKTVGEKISPTQFYPPPKGEYVPKTAAPTLKGKPIFGAKPPKEANK